MQLTNIYEIFVRSFYDSNNDKIGDIKGVILKLDYIKEMGYDGIWLMPIHPSSSYHKYNIDNYYDIDSEYGSLEDFKELLNEAHKRDIKIIIDLVINHTSHTINWFKECLNAHKNNDINNKYYNYYNFSDVVKEGYVYEDGLYYEARFGKYMPDLNLDSKEVRLEIKNIIEFWNNIGVDGYRLDAVTSYYTNEYQKNSEFLSYLRSISQDKYIVGEAWTHHDELKYYYETNYGSLFSFYLSDALILSIRMEDTIYLKTYLESLYNIGKNNIYANFIGNHDTNRAASLIEAKFPCRIKFMYGVISMLPGITYTYYGDEIGMIGEGNDPNRRIGMLWNNIDNKGYCKESPGTNQVFYWYDGVDKQLNDNYSILHYYKKCNHFRLTNPWITNTKVSFDIDHNKLLILKYPNNNIILNFSDKEIIIDLNDKKVIDFLDVNKESYVKDNKIFLQKYGIVITK